MNLSLHTIYSIVKHEKTLVVVDKKPIQFLNTFSYDALVMTNAVHVPSWSSTAEILGGLLPRLPRAGQLHEYRVWGVWDDVVGDAIARKARPSRIQHGKLFVTVSSSVFMHELQFSKARIKAQLNQKLGAAVIQDIFWVIGDVRAAETRPAAPPPRPLPVFTELTVPAVGNPAIERALAAVLTARRRRLAEEGRKSRYG